MYEVDSVSDFIIKVPESRLKEPLEFRSDFFKALKERSRNTLLDEIPVWFCDKSYDSKQNCWTDTVMANGVAINFTRKFQEGLEYHLIGKLNLMPQRFGEFEFYQDYDIRKERELLSKMLISENLVKAYQRVFAEASWKVNAFSSEFRGGLKDNFFNLMKSARALDGGGLALDLQDGCLEFSRLDDLNVFFSYMPEAVSIYCKSGRDLSDLVARQKKSIKKIISLIKLSASDVGSVIGIKKRCSRGVVEVLDLDDSLKWARRKIVDSELVVDGSKLDKMLRWRRVVGDYFLGFGAGSSDYIFLEIVKKSYYPNEWVVDGVGRFKKLSDAKDAAINSAKIKLQSIGLVLEDYNMADALKIDQDILEFSEKDLFGYLENEFFGYACAQDVLRIDENNIEMDGGELQFIDE